MNVTIVKVTWVSPLPAGTPALKVQALNFGHVELVRVTSLGKLLPSGLKLRS